MNTNRPPSRRTSESWPSFKPSFFLASFGMTTVYRFPILTVSVNVPQKLSISQTEISLLSDEKDEHSPASIFLELEFFQLHGSNFPDLFKVGVFAEDHVSLLQRVGCGDEAVFPWNL